MNITQCSNQSFDLPIRKKQSSELEGSKTGQQKTVKPKHDEAYSKKYRISKTIEYKKDTWRPRKVKKYVKNVHLVMDAEFKSLVSRYRKAANTRRAQ